jgi:hypothetical protein
MEGERLQWKEPSTEMPTETGGDEWKTPHMLDSRPRDLGTSGRSPSLKIKLQHTGMHPFGSDSLDIAESM